MSPHASPKSPDRSQPGTAAHVQVEQLTLERGGRTLLADLTLAVPRGAFVAITGPSGIGKTSFLEALAGTLPPAAGQIRCQDASGAHHSPRAYRRRIGVIFQELLLTPGASALDNVLCGALGRHPWWRTLLCFPPDEEALALDCLGKVRLRHLAHRPATLLSGGEQQRVAIARTLVQNPELILADEPVSQLDAGLAWEMMSLLKAESRHHGRTVLCVLHDLRLVEAFADVHLEFPLTRACARVTPRPSPTAGTPATAGPG